MLDSRSLWSIGGTPMQPSKMFFPACGILLRTGLLSPAEDSTQCVTRVQAQIEFWDIQQQQRMISKMWQVWLSHFQWRIQKCWKGGRRKTSYQSRRHLSQMHTRNYSRKRAAFWKKYEPMEGTPFESATANFARCIKKVKSHNQYTGSLYLLLVKCTLVFKFVKFLTEFSAQM